MAYSGSMNKERENLRIAEVIGKVCGGGVENFVFQYLRAINRYRPQQASFTVFYTSDSTRKPPHDLLEAGVRFIQYPSRIHPIGQYHFLLRQFLHQQYDIVHVHLNSLSAPALDAAKAAGIHVRIVHSHTTVDGDTWPRRMLKRFLARYARKNATILASCSPASSRALYTRQQIDSGKVTIIPNAIDFEVFQSSLSREEPGRDITTGKTLSLIGRLERQKNPLFVVPVLSALVQRDPSWRLLVVGDGTLKKSLLSSLRSAGLLHNVSFTGVVSSTAQYYHQSDVIIMPSLFEGLPFTAIEAQVARVPLVGSPAIPSIARISNGLTTLSLEAAPQKWADTIISASQKPVRLNDNAVTYDISQAGPRLLCWYQELAESRLK